MNAEAQRTEHNKTLEKSKDFEIRQEQLEFVAQPYTVKNIVGLT